MFDATRAVEDPDATVFFTGEMVYPFMFDEADGFPCLKPMKKAADLLAAKDDWGALYDPDTLRRCSAPTAAAVYYDDMYVVRDFSLEVGKLMGTKVCLAPLVTAPATAPGHWGPLPSLKQGPMGKGG